MNAVEIFFIRFHVVGEGLVVGTTELRKATYSGSKPNLCFAPLRNPYADYTYS